MPTNRELSKKVTEQNKEILRLQGIIEQGFGHTPKPPRDVLDMSKGSRLFRKDDFSKWETTFVVKDIDDVFQIHWLGDVHTDLSMVDGHPTAFGKKAFAKYRKVTEADMKYNPNIWFARLADSVDFGRSSEEGAKANKPFADCTRVKDAHRVEMEAEHHQKMTSFTQGKNLFWFAGNHNATYRAKDIDITMEQLLADMMGGDFLGRASFITLNFEFKGEVFSVPVVASHFLAGGGGILRATAMKRGHDVNKEYGSVISVAGHHHHLYADTDIVMTDGFKQKRSIAIGCGGYQAMYENGFPCYGMGMFKGIRVMGTPVTSFKFVEKGSSVELIPSAEARDYTED